MYNVYLHQCLLDEEYVKESVIRELPEESKAFLYQIWKSEFNPTGKALLEHILEHHSHFEPL